MATGWRSEYCQRIGAQWIGFPTWQLGGAHERDKLALSKVEKKCAGLIRDLMKRKGGSFFEFAVDPTSDESGGLDDYFEKVSHVCLPCWDVACSVCERSAWHMLSRRGRQTCWDQASTSRLCQTAAHPPNPSKAQRACAQR